MSSLLSTIGCQVQQLFNMVMLQYINTGDRMKDNLITSILSCSVFFTANVSSLYALKLYRSLYRFFILKEDDSNPIDICMEYFDFNSYNHETITKYKYYIELTNQSYQIHSVNVHLWIEHIYKTLLFTESVELIYHNNHITNDLKIKNSEQDKQCFMPIWKYRYQSNIEYIWCCNNRIYSNNYHELLKCCQHIEQFINQQDTDKKQKSIGKCIYKSSNNSIIGKVNQKKTFDTIFFDEKPKLLHIVDKFKQGIMYPPSLPIDNKLGILLHGPPGTGKTGCITALANYLDRNIVMVSSLTDDVELLFRNLKQYINNSIIVFDEFDHILTASINEQNIDSNLLEACITKEDKKIAFDIIRSNKKNDIIGTFLRQLDGIEDQSGRIIVATTNFPEAINPAFLRPGRFDIKLELGYCSHQMFQDIIRCKYPDGTIDNSIIMFNEPKTPLELINTLLQTDSLEECLEKLHGK